MNEDELLPHAVRVYEQELDRLSKIDGKSGQHIGFIGVIIAIFSFIIGDNFETSHYLCVLILGLGVLLSSIILSITKILYPTKRIPTFNVELYYQDMKKGQVEDTLLEVYLIHIQELADFVTDKARWLAKTYLVTLFGIAISFIGIMLSII